MVSAKYIYTRNFFYRLAKERFLTKMKTIKNENSRLTAMSISATNPSVISSIRNGKINKNNKSFIPDRIAEQIQQNLKIDSTINGVKDKYAYSTILEVFWGEEEDLKNLEFELFYCIVKDMLSMFCKTNDMSCSYTILLQNLLKNYIEYAEILSLINLEYIHRTMKVEEFTQSVDDLEDDSDDLGDIVITNKINYIDTEEWKETNLRIPKKIYRFNYIDEEFGNPVFYNSEHKGGIFKKIKLSDIVKIEDKAIIYCYDKFIKQEGIAELFFETLNSFEVKKIIIKDGVRRPDYDDKPTFEVFDKVLNNFIEKNLCKLFEKNKATSESLGSRIHDMLFYQYISILNLVALDEEGEVFEETGKIVDTYLYKVIDTTTNKIEKIPAKLQEVAEKKEYEFKRVLLHEDFKYVEGVKKQYHNYYESGRIENMYEGKLKEYKKIQFSIMKPKDFVKYKFRSELVGIEYRMELGREKYLLLGDLYNIY